MRKTGKLLILLLVLSIAVLVLSSCSSGFSNKYGTPDTKCAHPGCNNKIASTGDTNCCTTHSRRCANCRKYIDEDATYCMDCIKNAIGR